MILSASNNVSPVVFRGRHYFRRRNSIVVIYDFRNNWRSSIPQRKKKKTELNNEQNIWNVASLFAPLLFIFSSFRSVHISIRINISDMCERASILFFFLSHQSAHKSPKNCISVVISRLSAAALILRTNIRQLRVALRVLVAFIFDFSQLFAANFENITA